MNSILQILVYVLLLFRETSVQSRVESYQRLKKMALDAALLNTQHYKVRVKWSNPGNGVAPFHTPWCSSYWKVILRVTLDWSRQLYFLYTLLWVTLHHSPSTRTFLTLIPPSKLICYQIKKLNQAKLYWQCYIYRLHICWRVRPPATGVLDMTLNNLMGRFHWNDSFGECWKPLHCNWSQFHSGSERLHLIESYLWVE